MTLSSPDKHDEKEPLKNGDFVQSQVRTPPPPGFSIDNNRATFYGSNRDGAGSAPPLSLTSDLLGNSNSFNSSLDDLSSPEHIRSRYNNLLKPATTTAAHFDQARGVPTNVKGYMSAQNGRSSSYVNLAAALGEGLAESMGDSLADVSENANT